MKKPIVKKKPVFKPTSITQKPIFTKSPAELAKLSPAVGKLDKSIVELYKSATPDVGHDSEQVNFAPKAKGDPSGFAPLFTKPPRRKNAMTALADSQPSAVSKSTQRVSVASNGRELNPAATAQYEKMGQQLTVQFERVKRAAFDIVLFGAMLDALEVEIARDKEYFPNEESIRRGRGQPEGGLNKWLRTYTPEIPFQWAYKARQVARGIMGEFQVDSGVTLAALLENKPARIPEEAQEKRRAIMDAIEGKSMRQLLFDFTIGEAKDPEAPKPKREVPHIEMTAEELKKAEHEKFMYIFGEFHSAMDRGLFRVVGNDIADIVIDALKQHTVTFSKWRKLPQDERLALLAKE